MVLLKPSFLLIAAAALQPVLAGFCGWWWVYLIDGQITKLASDIQALSAGEDTAPALQNLHNDLIILQSSFTFATSYFTTLPSGPVNVTDAQNVVNGIRNFQETLITTLQLVSFVPGVFSSDEATIKQDFQGLSTDFDTFMTSLINTDAPDDLKQEVEGVRSEVDPFFSSAIDKL